MKSMSLYQNNPPFPSVNGTPSVYKWAFGLAVVVGDIWRTATLDPRSSSAWMPFDLKLPDRLRAMTFLFILTLI
jgi:hypothetical protein